MSGYAIQVRITGVQPRVSGSRAYDRGDRLDRDRADGAPTASWPSFEHGVAFDDPFAFELDSSGPTLGERLDRGREVWAQTTFFLFDPNSWR